MARLGTGDMDDWQAAMAVLLHDVGKRGIECFSKVHLVH